MCYKSLYRKEVSPCLAWTSSFSPSSMKFLEVILIVWSPLIQKFKEFFLVFKEEILCLFRISSPIFTRLLTKVKHIPETRKMFILQNRSCQNIWSCGCSSDWFLFPIQSCIRVRLVSPFSEPSTVRIMWFSNGILWHHTQKWGCWDPVSRPTS